MSERSDKTDSEVDLSVPISFDVGETRRRAMIEQRSVTAIA